MSKKPFRFSFYNPKTETDIYPADDQWLEPVESVSWQEVAREYNIDENTPGNSVEEKLRNAGVKGIAGIIKRLTG